MLGIPCGPIWEWKPLTKRGNETMADKLDLTKPVQTRDGRPVRILANDMKADQPVVGVVTNNDGREFVAQWDVSGKFYQRSPHEGPTDLINVPPKPVKYYAHVYRSPESGEPTLGALSRDAAYPPQCDLTLLKTIELEVQP